jgi:hypothetical protein
MIKISSTISSDTISDNNAIVAPSKSGGLKAPMTAKTTSAMVIVSKIRINTVRKISFIFIPFLVCILVINYSKSYIRFSYPLSSIVEEYQALDRKHPNQK